MEISLLTIVRSLILIIYLYILIRQAGYGKKIYVYKPTKVKTIKPVKVKQAVKQKKKFNKFKKQTHTVLKKKYEDYINAAWDEVK